MKDENTPFRNNPSEEMKELREQNQRQLQELEALRTALDNQQRQCAQLAEQLNFISAKYNEILQARYWRWTEPMRRVTGAVKSVLWRCKPTRYICKAIKSLLKRGPVVTYRKTVHKLRQMRLRSRADIISARRQREEAKRFAKKIRFSILVPLYNTPKNFLNEMLQSVRAQTYENWELCLADGSTGDFAYVGEICQALAKRDSRIRYKKLTKNGGISENTNACLEMATGDYIALFDHDDLLHPAALFEYAKVINAQDADFIYCDEDKCSTAKGPFFEAHYKPDFAPDNLRAYNYICHFTVFKKSLIDVVGAFRKEFDGSQDHDLVLRLTEKAEHIVHIPKILYHWRVSDASVASDPYAKPYTITAGIHAVQEHLARCGLKGKVESSTVHPNIYRIRYDIIGHPKVSVMIPSCNHADDLARCIDSILEKTTYDNYEIVIVENNSNRETFRYYDTLKQYDNIHVTVYKPPKPGFNYSAINNFGFEKTTGDYVILLNNDIEILSPDWMQEMLMFAQRKDVGAVGAKLYYPDDTIQHAGVILGVGGVAGHSHKHFPRNTTGYMARACFAQDMTAVTAACMMLRRDVFRQVGGLDESFAVAFNDIDFCMRIRAAGYLIVFTPYAEMYHYESKSRGMEDTAEKQKRFRDEVLRFQARWDKELAAGDPYYNPNLTLENEDFSEI